MTNREKAKKMLIMGSWHTYTRMTFDENVEFVKYLLDNGINQFDCVDYWDCAVTNTDRFRKVFETLGVKRNEYEVGVKTFPSNVDTRDAVLRKELDRLGIEYVDSVMCSRPSEGESMEHACECMSKLVEDGLAKRLDLTMWDPAVAKEAITYIKEHNLVKPYCMQFPYNVGRRDVVESDAYVELFKDGLKLQAGFTMEGGVLGGQTHRRRYEPEEKAQGIWFKEGDRNLTRDHGGIREKIVAIVPKLNELAATLGVTGSQLAVAYVATNPYLDSIVFGATKTWQVDQVIDAVELGLTQPEKVRELADQVYVSGAAIPGYFDYGRFSLYKK